MREREIFIAALQRDDPKERRAFLEGACGADAGLWDRVQALLGALDRAGSFLQEPAADRDATAALVASRGNGPERIASSPAEGPGTVIGPYKLREQIGEGGMGVVYVAEQAQPVRRKVALKIIKPGMDTRQVIARFEAERQALALMDHPHIARVYDAGATSPPCEGGVTGGGRPYFVMELVRGIPITDYCDREKLSIPERLELFVQVCRAVQHAHQKGIIHRDLKPSNILVTVIDGAAVPKVIDFGVAKATGASLTDRTIYTAFQQFVGTPLYMSPEQADLAGLDVDTRSDIYSLGVLLYELLTGTTPFDQDTFRTAAFDEVRRIIREQEPPKPSTRLSSLGATRATVSANRQADAHHLNRTVRGELDWIVMKALEKDRRRRYETANDFAADVMRYLTHQPVEACPPSPWYRFGKLARRNRGVLATVALVALALAAGSAVSVWQAIKAREAAADASQRADESKQVIEYLAKDVFGASAPGKMSSRSVTVGELLGRADATLGERFRRKPLVEASVRMALADSYGILLDYGPAERNAARAVQIRERYLGSEHPATLEALALQAWSLRSAGWPHEQAHEQELRKSRAAEPIARRELAIRRRVLGPTHPDTLSTQAGLALILSDLGRHEDAEDLAAQAEALGVRFLGPESQVALGARFTLGLIAQRRGNLDRAEALLRQVLAAQEQTLGRLDRESLSALQALAYTVGLQGRAEEARLLTLEAVNRVAQVYGLCHIRASSSIHNLFSLLKERRDYTAIRDLCEGWIREILTRPPEPDPYDRHRRSLRLSLLASTLITLPAPIPFDGALAVRAAEQAAEQGQDTQDNNWTRLALVHLRLGNAERAEWAVRESMKRRKGDDCFDSMTQALLHARRGELDEARAWFERAAREGGRDHGPPGRGYEQARDEVAALLGVKVRPADVFARP
jgi:serine/threonine protein kinase/tetratricopeptide (TPR) repeat protein